MAHTLPPLPYDKAALEPHIDTATMEIHHGRHHNAYVTNLNAAIAGNAELEAKTIEDLCKDIATVPEAIRYAVRNNGGGHFNHSLFWTVMSPDGGGEPTGAIGEAITATFGSYDKFKEEFTKAATTRFGSGWAWLCKKEDGSAAVCSTPNQDNPLMPVSECQGTPVLGLDVWEHAYYLNYQNRRPDYVTAFFDVINWDKVEERFNK